MSDNSKSDDLIEGSSSDESSKFGGVKPTSPPGVSSSAQKTEEKDKKKELTIVFTSSSCMSSSCLESLKRHLEEPDGNERKVKVFKSEEIDCAGGGEPCNKVIKVDADAIFEALWNSTQVLKTRETLNRMREKLHKLKDYDKLMDQKDNELEALVSTQKDLSDWFKKEENNEELFDHFRLIFQLYDEDKHYGGLPHFSLEHRTFVLQLTKLRYDTLTLQLEVRQEWREERGKLEEEIEQMEKQLVKEMEALEGKPISVASKLFTR